MGNIDNIKADDLAYIKYTILRRAICYGKSEQKNYNRFDLERLCYEIEGKDLDELRIIHEKWIGY